MYVTKTSLHTTYLYKDKKAKAAKETTKKDKNNQPLARTD